MQTLPVFPLNTVLFPDASLPLRIFEPRYRQLLKRCLDGDRRFGVSLIKAGPEVRGSAEPFEIGTVARILHVDDEDKGTIPIETVGEERIRISNLDRSNPYLVADVEALPENVDPLSEKAMEVARAAADKYLRLLLTMQGEWQERLELPKAPLALSYFLGTMLLAQPARVRQALLEADPVSRRLRVGTMAIEEATRSLQSSLMRSGPGKSRSVFGLN